MRVIMSLVFAISLGAIMSDQAVADEKKDPTDRKSYDEKVTVSKWDEKNKKFLKPIEKIRAYRGEFKGEMVFYTTGLTDLSKSPKGSEITDKDGNVYVVERVIADPVYYISFTKLKPKDK